MGVPWGMRGYIPCVLGFGSWWGRKEGGEGGFEIQESSPRDWEMIDEIMFLLRDEDAVSACADLDFFISI